MMQYLEIEQMVFERRAVMLAAAEHKRLLKLLPDAANGRDQRVLRLASLRHWLGGQLVRWGTRLQGKDPRMTQDLANGQPCASLSVQ